MLKRVFQYIYEHVGMDLCECVTMFSILRVCVGFIVMLLVCVHTSRSGFVNVFSSVFVFVFVGLSGIGVFVSCV